MMKASHDLRHPGPSHDNTSPFRTDYKPFFWYEDLVPPILGFTEKAPVLIQAGRGIGKTSLLERIKEEIGVSESRVLHIKGRNRLAARKALETVRGVPELVLIDDLDMILRADPNESMKNLALVERLYGELDEIRQGHRFIATSTISVHGPLKDKLTEHLTDKGDRFYNNSSSPFFSQVKEIRLDPWTRIWSVSWAEQFEEEFGKRLSTPRLAEIWSSSILELTGGHPGLFGPALQALDSLCQSWGTNQGSDMDPVDSRLIDPTQSLSDDLKDNVLKENIKLFLEDYLSRDGVPRIRSAIRSLRDANDPIQKESFEKLLEIAKKGGMDSTPPPKMPVRIILRDEGLLYRDKITGDYIIPGSIMKDQIFEAAGQSPETILVLADAPDSEDRGVIIIRSSLGEHRISLVGIPWRVIRALHEKQGEFLTIDELREKLQLGSNRAVQNAVQRLRTELRAYQAAQLIENEYGRGYRFAKLES
jgi:hypothetical protein